MSKTRFTADLGNGQTATRTSTGFAYTHAVVSASRAVSWHTSRELADRGLAQAVRWYNYAPTDIRVVPVTGEQILLKRTSPADKNAARRAVLTRQITRMVEYLARCEAHLAAWDAGGAEQSKARLTRDFGEQYALERHASLDRETRGAPVFAREQIAKLEGERGALLAAKAEG